MHCLLWLCEQHKLQLPVNMDQHLYGFYITFICMTMSAITALFLHMTISIALDFLLLDQHSQISITLLSYNPGPINTDLYHHQIAPVWTPCFHHCVSGWPDL